MTVPIRCLPEAGSGPANREGAVGECLLSALGGVDAVGEGELLPLAHELEGVGALALAGLDGGSPDDLDGPGAGAVTTSHLIIELGDGAAEGEVAVLAVHVVGAGAGVVAEPDPVVLDLGLRVSNPE